MKKIAKNISKKLGSQEAALTPGSFQEALDKHEKQLNIAREAGDRAREGDVNFNLGNAYKSHGDFRKAIECYEKSLTISRQAGNRGGEGDVYFNLGNAYESHGNFPKAVECYEKSLNIYRQAGNRCGEGNAYFNLGIEYNSHGDFPKAIECFEKSLDIYREAGNRGGEGDVYLNLGNAYKSHGDFPKAIECYEKSLNIYRQAGNRVGEGNVYYYLGNAYNSHGDFPKAIECYEKSVNLYRQAGDQAREEIASCRLEVAYISRRDFPKAMECYRETLNIAREAGSRSGVSWPLTLGDVSKAESEDKSLALTGNIVESLVPPSCDPKETLHLDQTDLEQPTPETTAKDSNQVDVVKLLTNFTPAGTTESEDKSLALPCNVVESLVSPSCDPKEIVFKLKEKLHLDQADLEKPSAETTRMIRCLAATAKDSNRIDVVKHLREIMPAGTTGPLLPGKLDICDIPVENRTHLTIDMTVGGRWKAVADRLGLRGSEIQFLDERYPNPSEATLARLHGMNVDDLYDVLTECGLPVLADIL